MVERRQGTGKVGRPKEDKVPLRKMALRMPHELREEVERLAQEETRPLNGQIIALLKEALAARQAARTRRT